MGLLWGWDELADHRILTGIAREMEVADDGDWCIQVEPDPNDELLRNPRVGEPNTNMRVECEVEPPDDLHGRNAEDDAVMRGFLDPLRNRPITVTGTWSIDKAHRYDGKTSPCIFSECLDGKTEIHPITSILHERDAPAAGVRQFDFFVFSDDSVKSPAGYRTPARAASGPSAYPPRKDRPGRFTRNSTCPATSTSTSNRSPEPGRSSVASNPAPPPRASASTTGSWNCAHPAPDCPRAPDPLHGSSPSRLCRAGRLPEARR